MPCYAAVKVLRATVAALAWPLFLAAAIAVLTAAGRGQLAVPALTDIAAWRLWFGDRDAVVMVFALLRLATLAVGWYLAGVTVVEVVAQVARWQPLEMVAGAVTVPAARRLVQSALGLGLAAAALTVPPQTTRFPEVPSAATATLLEPAPSDVAVTEPLVDESERKTPAFSAPPVSSTPPVAKATSREQVWTVAPGDHFWAIAEHLLARAWDRAPTDRDITAYWSALIDSNLDRLADPSNPDLIFPGQRLRLPQPPPPP